jgi:hypothetical protein
MKTVQWIFEDDYQISLKDRDLLVGYLSDKLIPVEGYFAMELRYTSFALKYPVFAVKHFSSDPLLVNKLTLLCQKRGKDDKDVKRHYQNQLMEFVALYDYVALMGYQFYGWDKPSGKSGVAPEKNCDLALLKDGQKFFAEVKNLSSEILSEFEESQYPGWASFDPKYELEKWLKTMLGKAEKKGSDFLVCGTPRWRLRGFDESNLKEWLLSAIKGILILPNQCPRWPIESKNVSSLVIADPRGCFMIQVGK